MQGPPCDRRFQRFDDFGNSSKVILYCQNLSNNRFISVNGAGFKDLHPDNYHMQGCWDGDMQRFDDVENSSIGILYSRNLSNK